MFAARAPQTRSVGLAAAFELRCWARARLFAEGELELHDAVDKLHEDSMRDGLVAAVGQHAVQTMIGDSFGAVRKKLTAWDLGEAFEDHRGVLNASTLAELNDLVWRNDPAQFRKWMARLSTAERQAVGYLVTA
jgi:hypothetical protein